MKELNTMDWLELATSKDRTRYNLVEVYRGATELVATDGHRMHISNGLDAVKPHFLSGLDAEFPDYNQVMPNGVASVFELSVGVIEELVTALKSVIGLVKINKVKDKFAYSVIFEMTSEFISIKWLSREMVFSTKIHAVQEAAAPLCIKLGLDARYLHDALLGMGHDCTLNFFGETRALVLASGARKALVMPMRLAE